MLVHGVSEEYAMAQHGNSLYSVVSMLMKQTVTSLPAGLPKLFTFPSQYFSLTNSVLGFHDAVMLINYWTYCHAMFGLTAMLNAKWTYINMGLLPNMAWTYSQ